MEIRFMARRSKSKTEAAMAEIRKSRPDADLEFLAYDTPPLEAAHSAGLSFLSHNFPLDILILNAGALTENAQTSKDGLEWTFAVNRLAHFVFAMALLPALEKAAKLHGDVRTTSTTSAGLGMHRDLLSLQNNDEELTVDSGELWWKNRMCMYGRSKICNILFATEMSRRLGTTAWSASVRSNAIHPGTVPTGLNDGLSRN